MFRRARRADPAAAPDWTARRIRGAVEPIVSSVNSRRAGDRAARAAGSAACLSTDDANGPILRGLGSFEQVQTRRTSGAPVGGGPAAEGGARVEGGPRRWTLSCLHGGMAACLVRYLIPGLPEVGSVNTPASRSERSSP